MSLLSYATHQRGADDKDDVSRSPTCCHTLLCGQMENNGNSKLLLMRESYKAVCYQTGGNDWSQ